MEWSDVFKFITAAISSIAAGGAIVFALSSWLGKVWASRILEREKNELNKDLEATKRQLDILKETTLRFQNDKTIIYRIVVDVVAKLLSTFDDVKLKQLSQDEFIKRFSEFNEQRIKIYGYLGMLAPQAVMDAQDKLMNHLLKISQRQAPYDWAVVRNHAIALLNEVRKDIGIDKNPIVYNGDL